MENTPSRYEHSAREDMLKFVPLNTGRVLDIGCNSGGFGESLKRVRSVEVWGIEPNSAAAEKAKSLLDTVICGYFTPELAVPDMYFDAIVMNDVLEHMEDPWAALELAKKKLAKNGRLVISLPNIREFDNLLHILLEKDFRYESTGIRDSTHLRFFTRKSALRLMEQCGLMVEHIEGTHESWWTKSIARRLAFKMFPKTLEDTKYTQYAIVAYVP